MTDIGAVQSLSRYPVKSMQGQRVDHAEVDVRGLVGDRRWAVVDADSGAGLSAKRHPELLECSAQLRAAACQDVRQPHDDVTVTLPTGEVLPVTSNDAAERLSSFLDRPVRLTQAGTERVTNEFGSRYRPEDGPKAGAKLSTGLRGNFADGAPLHIVMGSELLSLPERDPRRFRPNIIIDDTPAIPDPTTSLIGRRLLLGTARVHITGECPRCVMVNMRQPELAGASGLLRHIGQKHDGAIGVYAKVTQPGRVATGDRLTDAP